MSDACKYYSLSDTGDEDNRLDTSNMFRILSHGLRAFHCLQTSKIINGVLLIVVHYWSDLVRSGYGKGVPTNQKFKSTPLWTSAQRRTLASCQIDAISGLRCGKNTKHITVEQVSS
jgi:hypothetical protein